MICLCVSVCEIMDFCVQLHMVSWSFYLCHLDRGFFFCFHFFIVFLAQRPQIKITPSHSKSSKILSKRFSIKTHAFIPFYLCLANFPIVMMCCTHRSKSTWPSHMDTRLSSLSTWYFPQFSVHSLSSHLPIYSSNDNNTLTDWIISIESIVCLLVNDLNDNLIKIDLNNIFLSRWLKCLCVCFSL